MLHNLVDSYGHHIMAVCNGHILCHLSIPWWCHCNLAGVVRQSRNMAGTGDWILDGTGGWILDGTGGNLDGMGGQDPLLPLS